MKCSYRAYVEIRDEIEDTALEIFNGTQPAYDNAHTIMHNAMHEITRIVNDDNCANPTINQLTKLAEIAARSIRYTNPKGTDGFQAIKRIADATEQANNGLNRLVARWGYELLKQYNSLYMTHLEWDGIES